MNRITFLLKAKTQYNLHSPYVYNLYTEVLLGHGRDLARLADRVERWFGAETRRNEGEQVLLTKGEEHILLLSKPHADHHAEQRLEELEHQYHVCIDLYDMALLLDNPRLHAQHFLLR